MSKKRIIKFSLCLRLRNLRSLVKFFFFSIIFFITSCHQEKADVITALSKEEKKDLDYFLHSLIFENYGGFVLFGSKPICEMSLPDRDALVDEDAFQQALDALSEEERKHIEVVRSKAKKLSQLERNPYQGWLVLQKVLKQFPMKNFLFRLVPSSNAKHYDLMLINIQETAFILAKNYEIFKEAAGGVDFHPLQVVFELQDANSIFWKNIFSLENHVAKGLLFGFGLKNSLFGNWRFSSFQGQLFLPSENHRLELETYLKEVALDLSTNQAPGIPIFGCVSADATKEQFIQEQKIVNKAYKGKDISKVTLQKLTNFEVLQE